jgi:D-xylose transport system substrate-binding protein
VPIAQGEKPPADLTPDKVNNGTKEVPSALLDTTEITKDNIDDTLVKDGFLKAADICTAAYASACKAAGIV